MPIRVKHKENLWKTRHFVLNRVDSIDSFYANRNATRQKCPSCLKARLQNPQDDTHTHVLYECPNALIIWDLLGPVLNRINHPKINTFRPKRPLIIGVDGRDKKSIIANTFVTAIITELWRVRNDIKYQDRETPPGVSATKIIAQTKYAIKNKFLIAKRGSGSTNFYQKRWSQPSFLSIRNEMTLFSAFKTHKRHQRNKIRQKFRPKTAQTSSAKGPPFGF